MNSVTLNKPKHLREGDRVALIAPASPAKPGQLETAVDSIRFLNLEPVVYPSCTKTYGYLSGTDQERTKDIVDAFFDPTIDGIFCLRGGYGTPRLLPMLDYEVVRNNPKIFLGFSDITALHTAFRQLCRLPVLHGPMPSGGFRGADALTIHYLKAALFSCRAVGAIPPSLSPQLVPLYPGRASGPLTGGNLTLLAAGLGTPYELDTKGKLLFIEEVGEPHYKIDRALNSLELAGKFRDCSGIIFGIFSDCGTADTLEECQIPLLELQRNVARHSKKPAVAGFQAGHVSPHITLPLGIMASLHAFDGTLELLEAASE